MRLHYAPVLSRALTEYMGAVDACCRDLRQLDEVKSQLLGCLLFLDSSDLLAEWARDGRAAPAPGALKDPHPALQLLMSVDAAATMTVLQVRGQLAAHDMYGCNEPAVKCGGCRWQ